MKKKSTFYVLLITLLIISFNGLSKSIGISNYALDKNVYLSQNYNPLEDYVSLKPDYFKQEIAIATCNPITVYLDASGNITITPSDIDPSNVGPNFSLDISSFTCADIGTPVTVTITDSSDSLTCTSSVTVLDSMNPITPILNPVTVDCNGTLTIPTTTDNCTGTINGTTSDTLAFVEGGSTIINWTFDDGNGNFISVPQTYNYNDTTAPTPDVANLPDVTGECSATATAPTATDNCEGTITG
ncbi:hypothetical protein, partial [Xanthomarina gelatinilytica]|uniref:hypothetical protein n=1 Tax=Xanthomarina gelatinilytica TaxID=1137281 RepID=UPI003AA8770E